MAETIRMKLWTSRIRTAAGQYSGGLCSSGGEVLILVAYHPTPAGRKPALLKERVYDSVFVRSVQAGSRSAHDLRYVVKMEVFAAMDTASEEEDDNDQLQEIQDILQRLEDAEDDKIGEEVCQQLRFDLCPECRRKFVKNPLGRENFTAKVAGFSKN